jgi:hypothetical protein
MTPACQFVLSSELDKIRASRLGDAALEVLSQPKRKQRVRRGTYTGDFRGDKQEGRSTVLKLLTAVAENKEHLQRHGDLGPSQHHVQLAHSSSIMCSTSQQNFQ